MDLDGLPITYKLKHSDEQQTVIKRIAAVKSSWTVLAERRIDSLVAIHEPRRELDRKVLIVESERKWFEATFLPRCSHLPFGLIR
jgi:hypothetical protein